jgi:hypothetical protein
MVDLQVQVRVTHVPDLCRSCCAAGTMRETMCFFTFSDCVSVVCTRIIFVVLISTQKFTVVHTNRLNRLKNFRLMTCVYTQVMSSTCGTRAMFSLSSELWRFDTSTRGWEAVMNTVANGAVPSARVGHVMTSVGLGLWLHGGGYCLCCGGWGYSGRWRYSQHRDMFLT